MVEARVSGHYVEYLSTLLVGLVDTLISIVSIILSSIMISVILSIIVAWQLDMSRHDGASLCQFHNEKWHELERHAVCSRRQHRTLHTCISECLHTHCCEHLGLSPQAYRSWLQQRQVQVFCADYKLN